MYPRRVTNNPDNTKGYEDITSPERQAKRDRPSSKNYWQSTTRGDRCLDIF